MFGFVESFPVKRPYAPENNGGVATASGLDTIVSLDFKNYRTFTHVVPTTSCVWVACSDLTTGTFSHIRSDRNPEQYVRVLSGVWNNTRPGVVLIGARSIGITASMDFATELRKSLTSHGFRIMGEDLGGGIDRREFEMTPQRVKARRIDGVPIEFDFE
jgi:hypothetical protein